jgi:L-ascorbate metabolism protein UlaG (beta-lactamase superfamily)
VLRFSDFIKPARFGKRPSGQRLERITRSPNYKDGAFQNQSFTPNFTGGANYLSVMKKVLFGKDKRSTPVDLIPSTYTDLFALDLNQDVLIWFGHSSYFMQIDQVRILVDPVMSGSAAPFSFSIKAFNGTDRYSAEDIPPIDYLFITHDHYDHLDYKTIVKLKHSIKHIICGLGTGEHLERWGYQHDCITEMDWNEVHLMQPGFTAHAVPSRHFSGRGFKRNQALWASFVLKTPTMQIFIGGDSGYDAHFKTIGNQFGYFDLAIIENGQYDAYWKHIHLMPYEILRAAKELKANRIFPVHSGKFALGNHAWDEPLRLITENNEIENLNLITPIIGEVVRLKDPTQSFSTWWNELK